MYWLLRSGAAACLYAAAALPPAPWLEPLLPAWWRPLPRPYGAAFAAAHAARAGGAALLCVGAGAGRCAFGAAAWLYDAGCAPFIYAALLAGHLSAAGELTTDLLLYSEMQEAQFI